MINAGDQAINFEIILNVYVYCLAFPSASEYDSRLNTKNINDLFVSANAVWKYAGIRWKVVSCQKRIIDTKVSARLIASTKKKELRQLLGQIFPIVPLVIRERIWEVCLLHHFPVRSWGVYLPETKTIFLSELSKQNELNAVTLAHELGHMLGLSHVKYDGNLMNTYSLKELQNMLYSPLGFDTQPLNEQQIADARTQTKLGPY